MDHITFRRAVKEDWPQIMELQTSIFHGEQGIPLDDIAGFFDRDPQCWCAVLDDTVIGAVAAWNENGVLHWGRFVIHPDYRGHHIGTQMARLSFDDLFSLGVTELYMEARDITAKIVCRMGGQIVGEPQPFYIGTITPIILRKYNYRS